MRSQSMGLMVATVLMAVMGLMAVTVLMSAVSMEAIAIIAIMVVIVITAMQLLPLSRFLIL